MNDLLIDPEKNISRCWWCGDDKEYVRYHDEEWGYPVDDDTRLFEKLCLEGFQAGLSWLTILRRREGFRAAFAGFNVKKLVKFSEKNVAQLVLDASIIRHRGKIESVINNASRAIEIQREFGSLANFIWHFEPDETQVSKSTLRLTDKSQIPTTTPESTALSKALKKRGWSFVGPTTCYAFMQSMGLVNDHLHGCASRTSVENARKSFQRPEPIDV